MRAEQAEPVAGRGQRAVVQEWEDQQRAGAWEARVISAEAAKRDLRPVCPGPTRTGGTPSRGWRTSPNSVTGWPPR